MIRVSTFSIWPPQANGQQHEQCLMDLGHIWLAQSNRCSIRKNLGYRVFGRFEGPFEVFKTCARASFFGFEEIDSRGLIDQQRRRLSVTNHAPFVGLGINTARCHVVSPMDLTVAANSPSRYRICGVLWRQSWLID